MRVSHIIETHVQADHVSGARRLAEATGAPIFMHQAADVRFPHTDLEDEDQLDLGNVGLKVVATPGHTPDGVSLLVTDRSRATEPWFILTGDTLFSGGVGRPHLLGSGAERTGLPLLGEEELRLRSKTAIRSFIVSCGITKAVLYLIDARLSERVGRKPLLVIGWLFALPVPFLLICAPSWWWIDVANILLGINQSLAWSMTVIMKVDLVGPKQRGLVLVLNEVPGYFVVG